MIYLLPWLISVLQGFFLLSVIMPKAERPRMPLFIFWSVLIGYGTSAILTFTSFLFFNTLIPLWIIGINISAVIGLAFLARKNTIPFPFGKTNWDMIDLIGLHVLLLFMVPVVIAALVHPDGGWDAWSCWNLKAKFLFLGGVHWRGMLDPALWRSNIAYPFLLPLMNVWSWSFGNEPNPIVPLIASCRITFLMAGLLFFGLKELGGKISSLLASLWVLSIMFVVTLASSQYSDLLVGVWLLSALLAFKLFVERRAASYLTLTLISLGLMSFTKSEGLVLALICLGILGLAILLSAELRKTALASWKGLLLAGVLAFLPTLIFQTTLAPDSHTFINGLTSADKPASVERLQATLMFLWVEIISLKWNGFWFILFGGALLAGTKAFRRGLWVIPAIIGIYLIALTGVYTVNTFFPVIWWLSTTLNRILFALIPALAFWLFTAL